RRAAAPYGGSHRLQRAARADSGLCFRPGLVAASFVSFSSGPQRIRLLRPWFGRSAARGSRIHILLTMPEGLSAPQGQSSIHDASGNISSRLTEYWLEQGLKGMNPPT